MKWCLRAEKCLLFLCILYIDDSEQQCHIDIGHKSPLQVGKIHLNSNGPNSTILNTLLYFGIGCCLGFKSFVMMFLYPHVHHFMLTHRFLAVIARINQEFLKGVSDTDKCIG